jgi:Holliday junction resolvase
MSAYSSGRTIEYAAQDDLVANGYFTQRAASSKGMADLIAVKAGQVLFVSCKKTRPDGPADRAKLLTLAGLVAPFGVPLIAIGPKSKLAYRRLTGVGPQDWVAWTPDEIGDAA